MFVTDPGQAARDASAWSPDELRVIDLDGL